MIPRIRSQVRFLPEVHHKPDSGRPRRSGPAPIRASEGLRAPVAMVVSPRPERAGQADQEMGGRVVRHSRRLIFQLSEVSVPRWLFQGVLDRKG